MIFNGNVFVSSLFVNFLFEDFLNFMEETTPIDSTVESVGTNILRYYEEHEKSTDYVTNFSYLIYLNLHIIMKLIIWKIADSPTYKYNL